MSTVSPAIAMAILVYDYGLSSGEALTCVWRALEREKEHHEILHGEEEEASRQATTEAWSSGRA